MITAGLVGNAHVTIENLVNWLPHVATGLMPPQAIGGARRAEVPPVSAPPNDSHPGLTAVS